MTFSVKLNKAVPGNNPRIKLGLFLNNLNILI